MNRRFLMSDIKLGELVTEEVERDAIHIAIVPVRATETLRPGQHIGLQPGSELFVGKSFKPHIGIVDPFLKKPVKKDDIFYMCLYQNTVTGMRHHWLHPSFSEAPKAVEITKVKSEEDLLKEEFAMIANQADVTYNRLYEAFENYAEYGEYTYNGSNESYSSVSSIDRERAWEIFEILSGKVNNQAYSPMPFSCSC